MNDGSIVPKVQVGLAGRGDAGLVGNLSDGTVERRAQRLFQSLEILADTELGTPLVEDPERGPQVVGHLRLVPRLLGHVHSGE